MFKRIYKVFNNISRIGRNESSNEEGLDLLSSSSIIVTNSYKGFDKLSDNSFSFRLCEDISEICGKIERIGTTDNYYVSYDTFCSLSTKGERIVLDLADEFKISEQEAAFKIADFFQNNNIMVKPVGFQNFLYKFMRSGQNLGSVVLCVRTMDFAVVYKASASQVFKAQPLMVVALPFVGSIFFTYTGYLIGDNFVGKSFTYIGSALSLPMRGVEIFWNSYPAPLIHKITGVPVIINATKTLTRGPGFTPKDLIHLVPGTSNSLWKTAKEFVIIRLGGKV